MSIKPALSEREWKFALTGFWFPDKDSVYGKFISQHGEAALRLYDQPFGFTREDVKMCRKVDEAIHVMCRIAGEDPEYRNWNGWNDLADRIEALLPPEEE